MMVYLITLALSCSFAMLRDACVRKRGCLPSHSSNASDLKLLESSLTVLCAVPLCLVSGLRSGVGVDQALYEQEFEILLSESGGYVHTDVGFQALNLLVAKFTCDPMWLFMACSLILTIGVFFLATEFSDKLLPIVLLYFISFNYLQSFSLIAQYAAIGVVCLGFKSMFRNHFLLSAFLIALAVSLHGSSAVFYPILMFYYCSTKIRNKKRFLILSFILMTAISLMMGWLAPIVLQGTRYYVYFSRDDTHLNSMSYVVINFFVFLLFVFCRSRGKGKYDCKLELFFFLQYIALCLSLMQWQVALLVRMVMYFSFFQIYSIPLFLGKLSGSRGALILKLVVYAAFLAWFLLFPICGNYYEILPYRSVFEMPI